MANLEDYVRSKAEKLGIKGSFKLTRFESAYSNLVYKISNSKKNLVLKIIVDPIISEKKIAEKELALLKTFKDISPKVLHVDSFNKHPAIFMKFLDGPNLTKINLNKELLQSAEILAAIHSTKITPELKLLLSREYLKVPAGNLEGIEQWLAKFKNSDKIIQRVLKIYNKIHKYYLKHNYKIKPVLCHGDFNLRNIIKTKSGLKTFDWETAFIGDPADDINALFYTAEYDKNPLSQKQKELFLQRYLELRPDKSVRDRLQVYQNIVDLQATLWYVREYLTYDWIKSESQPSDSRQNIYKELEGWLRKLEERWL